MDSWEEIEKQPEFGLLDPQDRASLHDEWRKSVLSAALEADPDTVNADGLKQFIATSEGRQKSFTEGTAFDPDAAWKDYQTRVSERVGAQQQMLRDYDELEKAEFALKDARFLSGMAATEVDSPYTPQGNEEAAIQKVTEVRSRFTPELEQQAKEAREAIRGERPVAVFGSDIYTDPALTLDKEEYRKTVNATDASPEAKAKAIADFNGKRAEFAKAALNTFQIAGDIPGMQDFPTWEAGQSQEVRSLPPEDKALQYMREMKGRDGFRKVVSAISTGALQGGADIASQGIGVAAMVSQNPELAKEAAEVQKGAEVLGEVQKLEGDLEATGATTTGGVTRLGVGMAPAVVGAAATGGALPVAAALSGMQTAGAQFPSTFAALKEQGKSDEDAMRAATGSAILSGTITTALTALGGATGVEGLLRQGGKDLVKSRLLAAIKAVPGGALKEIPEELLDEAASQVIEAQTVNPDKPVSQTVDEFMAMAPDLALQVALLGGAGEAMGSLRETTTTPEAAAPDTDFAQRAALEGATEFSDEKAVEVTTADGTRYEWVPNDKGVTAEMVADPTNTPDILQRFEDAGVVRRAPPIVPPVAGVDTTELNAELEQAKADNVAPATLAALEQVTAQVSTEPSEMEPPKPTPGEEAPVIVDPSSEAAAPAPEAQTDEDKGTAEPSDTSKPEAAVETVAETPVEVNPLDQLRADNAADSITWPEETYAAAQRFYETGDPTGLNKVQLGRVRRAQAPAAAEEQAALRERNRQQGLQDTLAATQVGDFVSFKINGHNIIGTVKAVHEDGTADVEYSWNDSDNVARIPRTRLSRPIASVSQGPSYQYTQEQNSGKAASVGLPVQPGVTLNAGEVIKQALAKIAAKTSMPQTLRAVARALQRVSFDGVDLRVEADARRQYAGYYLNDQGITEIGLNMRHVGRGHVDAVGTFIHEALHHATLAKIRDPQGPVETEAVQALEQLVRRVRAYAGLQEKGKKYSYETSNVEEFVSALFTRPDFQDFLAHIPDNFAPKTNAAKFRSVLTEIFRIIAQLVSGHKVVKGSTMEQAMTSALALFETPQRVVETEGEVTSQPERRFPLERALEPTPASEGTRSLFNPQPRPATPGKGVGKLFPATESKDAGVNLDAAYTEAAKGSSTAMVPIADVYAMAKTATPSLTPQQFMDAVNAANEAGTVMIGLSETQPAVDAAGEFRVGAAGTEMMVVSPEAQFSRPRDFPDAEGTFSIKEATAILRKRFGADAVKHFIIARFPTIAGKEWDAMLDQGKIALNLRFMMDEETLIQKAEHELAHAVFNEPAVQQAWSDLSASMPADVRDDLQERLRNLGYPDSRLDEETLVRFFEDVRAATLPGKWQAFMDVVIAALRKFLGYAPDERTARAAAARIIAAGEAALARGLDPKAQAFGQSLHLRRQDDMAIQRTYLTPTDITLQETTTQRETVDAATKIIGEEIAKDEVNGRRAAMERFKLDTSIPIQVRIAGLGIIAQQADTLALLSEGDGQLLLDSMTDEAVKTAGVFASDPEFFKNLKADANFNLDNLANEAGRALNIFNVFNRLTPEGFIRRMVRQYAKTVREKVAQNFDVSPEEVEDEIKRLRQMMREAGATARGRAIAAALRAFKPRAIGTKKIIESLFPQAGFRERMNKGGEGLVRNFFQMMAGARDPKGPLAEFDETIQNALSTMLRKVMEEQGLVAKNQSLQMTDVDKLVRSVSADALRFDKIAAADTAMQEEIAKVEDPERQAILRQAWEEATARMYTNIASDATVRRAINTELKERKFDWRSMFEKGQNPATQKAAVVDAVMKKVEGLLTDPSDPTVQRSLGMLRDEVGAAFDFIATTKRTEWLAYREGVEGRRRVAERRKAFLAALKNQGVAEKAINAINEKLAGPQRGKPDQNPVSALVGEHMKAEVPDFIAKMKDLGVDQTTAEQIDKAAATLRAEVAALDEANMVENLIKSLKPKPRAPREKIERTIRTLLKAGESSALDSQEFMDAFGEAFGLPPLSTEQRAEIKKLIREINALPKGAARVDKQQDLDEFMALWKGISARDVLLSMWYANILSGFSTQAIGLIGNLLNFVPRSFFNAMANPKDAAAYFQGAFGEGLANGIKEALAALKGRGLYKVSKYGDKNLIGALELLRKKGPQTPAEWVAYILSGGTRLRYVFRIMQAIDALAWNTAREGNAYLAAHRALREQLAASGETTTAEDFYKRFIDSLGGDTAQIEEDLRAARDALVKAGATPDLMTIDRMARETRNTRRSTASKNASNRFADRIVLQQEPEGIGVFISSLIDVFQKKLTPLGFPLGQLLVPFNKIVSNLFEQSLDYTPVGALRAWLGGHISDVDLKHGGFKEGAPLFDSMERRERAMASLTGMSAASVVYAIASAFKDEPDEDVPFMLYGYGPEDENRRRQMPKGWVPFSIKIGDTYIKFSEMPFGMMFAATGTAMDSVRYKNMDEKNALQRIAYVLKASAKSFMSQGVLSSVDTAFDVVLAKASEKKFSDIPANMLKGAIPAQGLLRDVSTMFDERKISNDTLAASFLRDMPFVKGLGTRPELNVFGEPVTFDGLPIVRRVATNRQEHPVADYLGRNGLLIPGMEQTIEVGQYLPAAEKDRLKRRAIEIGATENGVFTPEQNYEFKKRAGELTKVAVENLMQSVPAITSDAQRKSVQNAINRQVEIARRRAMLEAVPAR